MIAATGDTTKVRFHNKTNLTGYGNYDFRGLFPSTGKSWNKIMMKYTMGCASSGCSGWDYTTHIQVRNPTGTFDSTVAAIDTINNDTTWKVFQVIENFELGRVITPYGTYMRDGTNGYNNNWQQANWFDVSDFESLFHDSVTIRTFYSGWSSGYSVTLDFYFIEGTPPRQVLEMKNVWGKGGGSYGFGNNNDWEQKFMPEKSFDKLSNCKSAKLTFVPSGHGFDNSINAAEFYDEPFDVIVNKNKIATSHIWNDQCGQNPLYPQGGTWIYNRANWCPGTKVGIFSYEIGGSLNAGNNTIDINLAPYTYTGNQGASYTVSSILVQYGENNFTNEASLEAIISPSTDSAYIRFNPLCSHPEISIKNNGKVDLIALDITYGLQGNTKQVYHWIGKISFDETKRISLPMLDWSNVKSNPTFEVSISKPNGQTDEMNYNNVLTSNAFITPKLENKLIVWFKTNLNASENSYTFKDADGKTLYSRSGFLPSTLYKDTFQLPDGCINFELIDDGGDGIEWWANKQTVGIGYLMIKNMGNTFTKRIQPDFGSAITYRFNTTFGLSLATKIENESAYDVYPNPANDFVNIQSLKPDVIAQVSVFDVSGKKIIDTSMFGQTFIDTKKLNAGIYIIKIEDGESINIKKVLIQK